MSRSTWKRIVFALLVVGWIMAYSQPSLAQTTLKPGDQPLEPAKKNTWSIAIHGGAGADPDRWTKEQIETRRAGLEAALHIGVEGLKKGSQAMDVVESVIRSLEDNPHFNAGRGAVLNEMGDPVLDASIMDGRDLACGAVAGVRRVKNPITAARRVITETSHVLLSGEGADRFAESIQLELVQPEYFKTDEQVTRWNDWKNREQTKNKSSQTDRMSVKNPLFYLGTVGCVVKDREGNLAAGTSTGGLLGKKFGRLGDSPIIGAGTYAKNGVCAVSCTGTGELYIKNVIAATIGAKIEFANQSLKQSTDAAIRKILPEDSGGLIAVDHLGNIEMPYNTPGMARGQANSNGLFEVKLSERF